MKKCKIECKLCAFIVWECSLYDNVKIQCNFVIFLYDIFCNLCGQKIKNCTYIFLESSKKWLEFN